MDIAEARVADESFPLDSTFSTPLVTPIRTLNTGFFIKFFLARLADLIFPSYLMTVYPACHFVACLQVVRKTKANQSTHLTGLDRLIKLRMNQCSHHSNRRQIVILR